MTDEFAYYTQSAKEGVLRLRSLSDQNLLAAMDDSTPMFASIVALMGPDTNHSWITYQAAREAYERSLIDEITLDRLATW